MADPPVSDSCADKIPKHGEGIFVSTNLRMTYHVYILYSRKLNRFYVGCTNNIDNRIVEHNSGQSTYTSLGVPWSILWTTIKPSFRAAEDLEIKLKNLSRIRKIKFMRKYHAGILDLELLNRIIP